MERTGTIIRKKKNAKTKRISKKLLQEKKSQYNSE